jgi:hypothetical protein
MTIDRRVSYRIHKLIENNYFKGGKAIANILSKILLPLPEGTVAVENRQKQVVILNPKINKGIETSIYYTGSYEAGVSNIIENFLVEGDYFYELGSNVAPHSMIASNIVGQQGRVYTFEPDPSVKRIVDKNISLNSINNIVTINSGLGDKSINVDITTFDEYFQKSNIKRCDMIVLDVEGWEFQVLKGAQKTINEYLPLLCIEVNKLYSPKEIYEYVSAISSYRIFQLSRPKVYVSKLREVESFQQLRLDDNIFCLTNNQVKSLSKFIS